MTRTKRPLVESDPIRATAYDLHDRLERMVQAFEPLIDESFPKLARVKLRGRVAGSKAALDSAGKILNDDKIARVQGAATSLLKAVQLVLAIHNHPEQQAEQHRISLDPQALKQLREAVLEAGEPIEVGPDMAKPESDETECIRRARQAELNSQAGQRAALEAKHGKVWSTDELREEFQVLGFAAPLVAVERKRDKQKGSLEFQHDPRFYFNWMMDDGSTK